MLSPRRKDIAWHIFFGIYIQVYMLMFSTAAVAVYFLPVEATILFDRVASRVDLASKNYKTL